MVRIFKLKKWKKIFRKNKKYDILVDLKINDIPQTALSTIKAIKRFKKIKYITIHIMFRKLKALKAAKKINKKIKLLGVTILTSL